MSDICLNIVFIGIRLSLSAKWSICLYFIFRSSTYTNRNG